MNIPRDYFYKGRVAAIQPSPGGFTVTDADTDGITGFMYGMATSILARSRVHGEALRRWHNLKTQIGTEGEQANESGTTLNPALLSVGGK